MEKNLYNNSRDFFKRFFTTRVQKISIDAGFTCPNRDGTKSTGGCIYCNNHSFRPFYCSPIKSVSQQLKEGIAFFSKKYKTQQYLAYFQSFTNTYGEISLLERLYSEALSVDGVVGLVISTRPDCFDEQVAKLLFDFTKKYFVLIEFGAETTNDEILAKINRHHTFEDTQKALSLCNKYDLLSGLHLIFGLPGETPQQIIESAKVISLLNFNLLKIHQLQIVRNTTLATYFIKNPLDYKLFSLEEYIDLCIDFLEHLSPNIVVDRFTSEVPAEYLIAPRWGGIKNYEFVHKLTKRMMQRNTWQGRLFVSD